MQKLYLEEHEEKQLKALLRERATIQRAQRRIVLPPHEGGFKKPPSKDKQFDWQFRLDDVILEIDAIRSRCRGKQTN